MHHSQCIVIVIIIVIVIVIVISEPLRPLLQPHPRHRPQACRSRTWTGCTAPRRRSSRSTPLHPFLQYTVYSRLPFVSTFSRSSVPVAAPAAVKPHARAATPGDQPPHRLRLPRRHAHRRPRKGAPPPALPPVLTGHVRTGEHPLQARPRRAPQGPAPRAAPARRGVRARPA